MYRTIRRLRWDVYRQKDVPVYFVEKSHSWKFLWLKGVSWEAERDHIGFCKEFDTLERAQAYIKSKQKGDL